MAFDNEPPDFEAEETPDDGLFRCRICRVTEKEKYLTLCSICKSHFCDLDAFSFGGKQFCRKTCADYFFFGEGED